MKKKIVPFIVIILFVAACIFGLLYFTVFQNRVSSKPPEEMIFSDPLRLRVESGEITSERELIELIDQIAVKTKKNYVIV
jgi:hypothetical protein